MRIIGFQKIDWYDYLHHAESKMLAIEFSTWRFPRKDRDWAIGERAQVVIRARLPSRVPLGEVTVLSVAPHQLWSITDDDGRADGFAKGYDLAHYLTLERMTRKLDHDTPPNKLMLRWELWYPAMILYALNKYEAFRQFPGLKPGVTVKEKQ